MRSLHELLMIGLQPDADQLYDPQGHYNQHFIPNSGNRMSVKDLSDVVDQLIAEYNVLLARNKELRNDIDKHEKERLLLTRPQFFETEMEKIKLAIEVYTQSLEELVEQAQKTEEIMNKEVS